MDTPTPLPPEYQAFPATAEDRLWMDLIVHELHGWSKHRGAKHVAVITGPEGEFRALGYNGLPRGLDDSNPAFNEHPLKRQMTMCAERNALTNLRLSSGSPEGCTLHVDAVPCAACAKAIVEAGIKTVAMIGVQQHSTSRNDTFWKDGLSVLVEGGVEIRQHDPATEGYQDTIAKHYHPAIPSNTVDWNSRFLLLARYAARWTPYGVGEVLAVRTGTKDQPFDKIVRALGTWSPEQDTRDALSAAALSGITIDGCALYLSDAAPLVDPAQLARLADNGISCVVLPAARVDSPLLAQARPMLRQAGIDLHTHIVRPQDFSSLTNGLASETGLRKPVFDRQAGLA